MRQGVGLTIASIAAALTLAGSAGASQWTGWFTIAQYTTSQLGDWVGIMPAVVSVNNPDGCALADWYMTSSGDIGLREDNAAILAAYLSGREVNLSIDGCNTTGRPRIIQIKMRDP